ncbi:hypothetical protein Sjap_018052 [Stephania japonica]|uniref:Uncharacterized protein n=1 Tax=Stephania japonica TaxID=461633 RepID=A0AAP0I7C3_9MAGN
MNDFLPTWTTEKLWEVRVVRFGSVKRVAEPSSAAVLLGFNDQGRLGILSGCPPESHIPRETPGRLQVVVLYSLETAMFGGATVDAVIRGVMADQRGPSDDNETSSTQAVSIEEFQTLTQRVVTQERQLEEILAILRASIAVASVPSIARVTVTQEANTPGVTTMTLLLTTTTMRPVMVGLIGGDPIGHRSHEASQNRDRYGGSYLESTIFTFEHLFVFISLPPSSAAVPLGFDDRGRLGILSGCPPESHIPRETLGRRQEL